MLRIGMKDEVLPVSFRPNRIRGALHISRTGICSFIIGSKLAKADAAIGQQLLPQNKDIYQGEGVNDQEGTDQLVSS